MKYIAIVRGFNEPDNNTPSDEVFATVVECANDKEVMDARTKIYKDFEDDFIGGAEVIMYELDYLSEGYKRILETW